MKTRSLYVTKPFKYELKEIDMPDIEQDECLLKVICCGICGYDLEISASLAESPTALGHEYVAEVIEIGSAVTNVKVGDIVTAESCMACGYCEDCRNGRPDLCQSVPKKSIWNNYAQGFADYTIAPAKALVVCNNLDPMDAVLSEPCGVSLDLVKTAEINFTDDILIVGLGPIGLMALQIASHRTSGNIYVIDRHTKRRETALRNGATKAFSSISDIKDIKFHKVLLTAVPELLPECISLTKFGGYICFLGSNFRSGGNVTIDTHEVHFNKLQIRSSFASPAMYFPEVHRLISSKTVKSEDIITHIYSLNDYEKAINELINNKDNAIKVVIKP
ncbi:MAG: alcohol dehydrogenase catalytic domain-containing protein [Armatimonadetes bacterium]|nr:alcohol dehydrogenase catalytic domain-containing protein [Candidatus Hippobium faecium]